MRGVQRSAVEGASRKPGKKKMHPVHSSCCSSTTVHRQESSSKIVGWKWRALKTDAEIHGGKGRNA